MGLREEGGNNRGPLVELFLRGVEQPPGEPWCAAFVHHVGYWSHFDYAAERSAWPLPATASCYMLGAYARERGVLHEEPEEGDVFLLWNAKLARFAHTGVVVRVRGKGETPGGTQWFDCDTIEGNTDSGGSREGDGVMRRVRRFYPKAGDRFIRWSGLAQQASVGTAPDALPQSVRVA